MTVKKKKKGKKKRCMTVLFDGSVKPIFMVASSTYDGR
jgi:hypothetical protein